MTMTEAEAEQEAASRSSASKALAVLAGLAVVSTLGLWWLGSLPEEPEFEVGRVVFGNIPELVVALFYSFTPPPSSGPRTRPGQAE